jgi:uncharacterized protein GlcG (DUF336 family)
MRTFLDAGWLSAAAALSLLAFIVCPDAAAAELPSKKSLNLEVARQVLAAAQQHARENQWNVCIAIVDDGGHLICFERMDGTQYGSVFVAQRKAQTAIAFRRPTKAFEEQIAGGRNALLALPEAVPLEGGIPLSVDGQIVGAIGVSGVTSQQDGLIAQAGATALAEIAKRKQDK